MAGERDQSDMVSAMFAILTARLEDAAGMAAEAQARLATGERRQKAEAIAGLVAEAETLSVAIIGLLSPDPD